MSDSQRLGAYEHPSWQLINTYVQNGESAATIMMARIKRTCALAPPDGKEKKKNRELKHVLQEGNELDTLLIQLSFSLDAPQKIIVDKKNP